MDNNSVCKNAVAQIQLESLSKEDGYGNEKVITTYFICSSCRQNLKYGEFKLLFCGVRKEMHGNPCCTCSTNVFRFLTNSILALWRCLSRSRRLCLNSLLSCSLLVMGSWQLIGSLSMRVFETRTANGREPFAWQDSDVSQIFIPIISNGEKIISNVNVVV